MNRHEIIMAAAYTFWGLGSGLIGGYIAINVDPFLGMGIGILIAILGLRVCWG